MDNMLAHFLLPTLDGSIHSYLQLGFATVFVASVVLTIVMVTRHANPAHWARRQASLDASAASAPELCHAVATPAERWADILPSLLLVFGLLGTFIGLGLALTEAAGVLGPGADALSGLTPIMDSLGSKFKTSTWGILAFLLLKVCFMLKPYEERRAAWAAAECRQHHGLAQARAHQERADERQQLIDAVERNGAARLAEELILAFNRQHAVAKLQLQKLGTLAVGVEAMGEQQRGLALDMKNTAANTAGLIEHAENQSLRLSEMALDSEANRTAMDGFVGSVSGNMKTMANAANKMSGAAEAAGAASDTLGTVIGEFRETMVDVLGKVSDELGATMGEMSGTFSTNMDQMSAGLTRATTAIEDAIKELSTGVQGTVETLEKASAASVARQTIAQATFAASGDQLTGSIGMIGEMVKEMGAGIGQGLESVASSNQQMQRFQEEFAESNAQVRELVVQIKTMAKGIGATTAGLRATEGLGADLRMLATGIAQQQQAQAHVELEQQKAQHQQAELVNRMGALTSAIDAFVAAQKTAAGHIDTLRVADTVERIEASLVKLAQRRGGMRASDPLAA